jgi:CubicO group peptidase (beta-lactamase class C family)
LATILTAEIVRRISGISIQEFVRKEFVSPLGLASTGLGSQGFDRARIVRCTLPDYQQGTDFGWNSRYWQEFGSPTGGLFSTPNDFAVICAMMLDGGVSGGRRILSPAAAQMMTTNRMDDMPDMPEAIRRTRPWGLGWRLNHLGQADSWSDLLDRRVFGHTGSSGNVVWMNPSTKGFCIIFSNYLRSRAPWRLVHLSNIIASAFA